MKALEARLRSRVWSAAVGDQHAGHQDVGALLVGHLLLESGDPDGAAAEPCVGQRGHGLVVTGDHPDFKGGIQPDALHDAVFTDALEERVGVGLLSDVYRDIVNDCLLLAGHLPYLPDDL
ncbi:hypothetical protein [Streptomyces sp. NPDC057695]|uniref:hypothetical protein n=1 Tax=Streptomyces sp. NPDC057695 TaxID=3346217 RepID=UPI0036C9CE6A